MWIRDGADLNGTGIHFMRLHSFGPRARAFAVVFVFTVCLGFHALGQDPTPAPAPAGASESQMADPATFPAVVARVNGIAIERQELLDRVEAVKQRMHLPPGQTPLQVYKLVLGELVDFELLYQSSASRNAVATEAEVEAEMQQLRQQFPSEEAFQQQLSEESMTAERLKAMLQKDLSVQKMVEAHLAGQVQISEEDKRKFYDENAAAMQQPEQLRIRHLLKRVPEDATDEQKGATREQIEGLRRQIEAGAEFAGLAREHSDDPGSKENGGEMTVSPGQTVEPFEKAAFALAPGALSPVVETRFGFHLIQLLERTPGRQVPYEEVEARIQQFLQQQGLQQRVKQEVEALKAQATIEILL